MDLTRPLCKTACRLLALAAIGLGGSMAPLAAQPLPPLFFIRQGDLHGLIDPEGRTVLPAEFDRIELGAPWVMARKGARVAFFDGQGRMVIEPQEALTRPFTDGLQPLRGQDAQGRNRWGYADARRQMVLAPAWDDAGPFADGLAVVGLADAWGTLRYGAIDRDGKLVVPAEHGKLLTPVGGLLRAESRERTHRVFDTRGRDITPAGVDFVGVPSEGLVRIWAARLQGFMTVSGEVVVPPRWEQASEFKDGMARFWADGKFGFIDRSGRVAVPPRLDAAEDFSDGLALVRDGGQQVFIDRSGRHVLPVTAERAWGFSQGLAAVRIGGRHGYIDKSGRVVIEPRFTFARPFAGGLAYVGLGRDSAYIRPDGRIVWQSTR